MKRTIRLNPAADLDLNATFSYIEARNPRAALQWLNEMQSYFEMLAGQPELGKACDDIRIGMRRAIKNGYRILYRIAENEIVIVRILHPRREFDPSLVD